MQIRHDLLKSGDKIIPYIYIDLDDEYEFGKEFWSSDDKNSFIFKLKEYAKGLVSSFNSDRAILIINGVMVGAISLASFLGLYDKKIAEETSDMLGSDTTRQERKLEEKEAQIFIDEDDKKEENALKETKEETKENASINLATGKISQAKGNVGVVASKTEEKPSMVASEKYVQTAENNNDYIENKSEVKTSEENDKIKENNENSNVSIEKSEESNESKTNQNVNEASNKPEEEKENTKLKEEVNEEQIAPNIPQGIMIKLNLNGNVIDIELEEYIVGVVAAEMPASFDIEALKAQAVAARTYAMKKASAGRVLVASVSDQAYKTEDQMRQTWGSSFDYYYSRVRSAVNATKGIVMMYGGNYIDALYHAISSGRTELPAYIWNSSYPYLLSVDSSLDRNVKNYEVGINMDYGTISSKLGVSVSEDTPIEVLSFTESGRVNEISIGGAVFTGVQVRTKLGLRSTDFIFERIGGGLKITTKGYGHGVGMSQYGANELAKIGYSFSDILTHYYTGIYFASV